MFINEKTITNFAKSQIPGSIFIQECKILNLEENILGTSIMDKFILVSSLFVEVSSFYCYYKIAESLMNKDYIQAVAVTLPSFFLRYICYKNNEKQIDSSILI